MFYSAQIITKKGPLGVVWIAAHLDRQLKRQQVFEASIPLTVDAICDSEMINPETPLYLRLSGQLLLGVVRIYSRKVNYLQQDCTDAMGKINLAFKPAPPLNPSTVDLPSHKVRAKNNDINLPDTFDDLEAMLVNEPAMAFTSGPVTLSTVRDAPSVPATQTFDASGGYYGDEEFEVLPDVLPGDLDPDELEKLREPSTNFDQDGEDQEMFEVPDFNLLDPEEEDEADDEEQPSSPQPSVEPPASPQPAPSHPSAPSPEQHSPPHPANDSAEHLTNDTSSQSPGGPSGSQEEDPDSTQDVAHGSETSTRSQPASRRMTRSQSTGDKPSQASLGSMGGGVQLTPLDTPMRTPSQGTQSTPTSKGAAHKVQSRLQVASKRKVKVDVGDDGAPASDLPGQMIRALLMDRSSLLRPHSHKRAKLSHLPPTASTSSFAALPSNSAAALADLFSICTHGAAGHLNRSPPASPSPSPHDPSTPSTSRPSTSRTPLHTSGRQSEESNHPHQPDSPTPNNTADAPLDFSQASPSPQVPEYQQEYQHNDDEHQQQEHQQQYDPEPIEHDQDDRAMQEGEAAEALVEPEGSRGAAGVGDAWDGIGEDDAEDEVAKDSVHEASFTTRTKRMVTLLQRTMKQQQTTKAPLSSLQLASSCSRMGASRCFFELLVLTSKGYLELEQPNSYAHLNIQPRPKWQAISK